MPARQKRNERPELLRVLIEIHIEMEPDDTVEQWTAALEDDFFPQLPGHVSMLAVTTIRRCEDCGVWFAAGGPDGRKDKRFHTDACRMRAFRKRKKQPKGEKDHEQLRTQEPEIWR